MMPFRGPLLGHNDNVVHAGQVFHVQTEDLGPRRQMITTHLFADGGRIVHSARTSYAALASEVPGPDDLPLTDRLRQSMKAQHGDVIRALRAGRLDGEVAGSSPPEESLRSEPFSAPFSLRPGQESKAASPFNSSDSLPFSAIETPRHGGFLVSPTRLSATSRSPRFGARSAGAPRLDERIAAFLKRHS